MICYINCDKQLWEIEETGEKEKKQCSVEVSQLFLSKNVGLRYNTYLTIS